MTRRKKTLFIMIASFLFVGLVSSTYMLSYASYSKNDPLKLIYSGNIVGTHADFKIANLFVDGTSVDSLNTAVNYTIDSVWSYCYTTDPDTPVANTVFYTNSDNEVVFNKLPKSSKCDLYFKDADLQYWYVIDGVGFTYPDYSGTLQSTGAATGHDVYLAMGSIKHYACATISGNEICLSLPYTQYGLKGHSSGSSLTAAQQTSAVDALVQAFNSAGISITSSDCTASADGANCTVGSITCGLSKSGTVNCKDNTNNICCHIESSGKTRCHTT